MKRITEFEKGARAAIFVLYRTFEKMGKAKPNGVVTTSNLVSVLDEARNKLVHHLYEQHKKGGWND